MPQRVGGGIRKPRPALRPSAVQGFQALTVCQGHPEVVGDAVQVVARADHVDVAVGRARARLEQRVPARGRLGRRLRRRCRGGGGGRTGRRGSATRSGSAWGSGSRRGSGSAWALRSPRPSRWRAASRPPASRSARRSRPRPGPRRSDRPARPPSGSARRWRRRTRPTGGRHRSGPATDPAIAGVTIRAAADSVERLGHGHRAAQVARAVDVAAGQADELLLAQRLRAPVR